MTKVLPSNWEKWSLADVGEWVGGGTPSSTNELYWTGDIPWVSPKDMKVSEITSTQDRITQAAIDNSAAKMIPVNSVLFVTRSGILAHSFPVAINRVPVTVNQDLKAIIPVPVIDAKYLTWALRASARIILTTCSKHGTTVHSIEMSALKALSIPVPPPAEQRRIVIKIEELFSELDKGVESLEIAREQLNVYRQAVLKRAFEGKLTEDWRKQNKSYIESCSSLLEAIGRAGNDYYAREMREWQAAIKKWEAHGEKGKRPPKPEKPAGILPVPEDDITGLPCLPKSWTYVRLATLAQIGSGMSVSKDRLIGDPIEVPYLRVANVQRGKLDLSHMASMKIERTQLRSLALRKWDVLFNEGGDRDKLGRGWIWEEQVSPCITQNHVFRVSPYLASEAHSKFISYWGNTFGQEYFNTEGKQTTNLASINKSVLSAFPIPLPSMQEQAEIVNEIESRLSLADSLQAEIDAALERHTVLRQSILSKAISGQLVSQKTSDEPASALLERIKEESGAAMNGKKNSRRKEAA